MRPARTKSGGTLVRLEFTLPSARRLFLVVRGPAPSCRVAGVIHIRGRAGFNSVPFAGRLPGKRLEPGVYGLAIRTTRNAAGRTPQLYVEVVSARRTIPVPEDEEPSCDASSAAGIERLLRLLVPVAPGFHDEAGASGGATGGTPSAPLLPPSVPDADGEVVLSDLPTPPALGGDGRSTLAALASVAVLVAVGFLLVLMLTLVTRFLRGSWNP